MSCTRYHEAISDWVDGIIDVVDRRELEDHLAVCADCSSLAADLRRLKDLAGSLERLSPPAALWDRIEARTQESITAKLRFRTPWLGLAAAAVLLVAAALAMWGRSSGDEAVVARDEPEASSIELARTVEAELRLAEQHYENAIAGLERLARDRDTLDPAVAATLQRNLQLIDAAIGESRTALRAQPGSHPAQQSLFDAFRTKIALLEDTINLLSEIRRNSQVSNTSPSSGSNGDQSS